MKNKKQAQRIKKNTFLSVKVMCFFLRSGSVSLGVARRFFSQAFRIHALVILIFCAQFSAGTTRMETSFFFFFFLQHCSHAKNAKLLWRGSLFQALVEVSGLIFMDVRSPLGIVTTFRWVYTSLFFSIVPVLCVFSSLAYFSGLMDWGLNGQFSFFSSREDIFIPSPAHRFPIQLPSK